MWAVAAGCTAIWRNWKLCQLCFKAQNIQCDVLDQIIFRYISHIKNVTCSLHTETSALHHTIIFPQCLWPVVTLQPAGRLQLLIMFSIHGWLSVNDRPRADSSANQSEGRKCFHVNKSKCKQLHDAVLYNDVFQCGRVRKSSSCED